MNNLHLLLILLIFPILSPAQSPAEGTYIPYREKDRWGFADTMGRVVLKPQFDTVYDYQIGFFRVQKNGKLGLWSQKGEKVFDCQFKDLGIRDSFIITERSEGYELYAKTGKPLVEGKFRAISYLEVGLFELIDHENQGGVAKVNFKKGGFEKWVSKPSSDFSYATRSDLGELIICTSLKEGNEKITVYNPDLSVKKEQERVVEPEEPVFVDMGNEEDSGYFVSNPFESPSYQLVEIPSGKKFKLAVRQKMLADFMPKKDNIKNDTLSLIFDEIKFMDWAGLFTKETGWTFSTNVGSWAVVTQKTKKGVINGRGELILQFDYDEIGDNILAWDCKIALFKCKKNGYWGLVDHEEHIIVPFIYDDIVVEGGYFRLGKVPTCFNFQAGLLVRKGEKFGVVGPRGKLLVPVEMDEIVKDNKSSNLHLRKAALYGISAGESYFEPTRPSRYNGITYFNNYPVANAMDPSGKFLGYADKKGFYYFKD